MECITLVNQAKSALCLTAVRNSNQGRSIYKEVLLWPDLTNQIIGVFTRFHEEKIAFLADVEAMYHQVHVREDQQSFLKLLWSGFPTGVEDMGGSSKFDGGGGGLSQYMGGGGL